MVGGSPAAAAPGHEESVEAVICRIVESASATHGLPVAFLTRLIWQESSFRSDVVSRAGAQGVAQFMPGTARERGLADPFDPEQAIPAAASFLRDLRGQFGNLGLAAAAYNGGPSRVTRWLAGKGGLPDETRSYVARITGQVAEEWAAPGKTSTGVPADTDRGAAAQTCLQATASLRATGMGGSFLALGATAPWGVQLSGNFSKPIALASFERSRARYAAVLGDGQPMVIGTRLRFRGARTFYRVRLPAGSRQEANGLCGRIRSAGGACAVLRS